MLNVPKLLAVLIGTLFFERSFGKMRPVLIEGLGPKRQRLLIPMSSYKHNFNGSVLMDAALLETLPSSAIINFIARCADVTLDFDSCIVSAFVHNIFKDSSFKALCRTNNLDLEWLLSEHFAKANNMCLTNSDAVYMNHQQDADSFFEVVSNVICWMNVCGHEEITLTIESAWIQTCANISLPYPLPTSDEMFMYDAKKVHKDAIVTCMLDYAMSFAPSEFGLVDEPDGSVGRCFPPGYNNIIEVCPSIGRLALEKCYTAHQPSIERSDNYEMSSSLSYNYDSLKENELENELENNMYIDALCSILTKLSTKTGRDCLVPLCDITE